MTTIDPHRRLAAALQQTSPAREKGRSKVEFSAAAHQAAADLMAQRLRSIDRSDPERRHKAVRIYLESELAREFGQGLLNDPSFAQMVDAVQSQMQEDAETAAAMEKVGDLLLSGSPPS